MGRNRSYGLELIGDGVFTVIGLVCLVLVRRVTYILLGRYMVSTYPQLCECLLLFLQHLKAINVCHFTILSVIY